MVGWLIAAALAAAEDEPALLSLVVTDPGGRVVLDETVPVPLQRTISGEGHALGIWAAVFDERRAVVELVTGREKGGVPKPRFSRSDELDPFVPADLEIAWKKHDTWRVAAVFGRVWEAPAAAIGEGACLATDAAVVTSRELVARFDDGTGYTLAAGVPVEPRGDGRARARVGALSFDLRVVEGDLGVPPEGTPSSRWPEPTTTPEALLPGVVGHTALGEVRWEGAEPLPVAGRASVRADLVTVQVPCAELVLRPVPKEPAPPSAGGW